MPLLDLDNISQQLQAIYLSPSGIGTVLLTFNFKASTETFPIPITRGNYTYNELLKKVIYLGRQYLSNCRKITTTFGDNTYNYETTIYNFDGFSLDKTKDFLKAKSYNKFLMGLGMNGRVSI